MRVTPKVLCCGKRTRLVLEVPQCLWKGLDQFRLVLTACDGFVNNSRDVKTQWIGGIPVSHSTNGPTVLSAEPLGQGRLCCQLTPTQGEGEYILRLLDSGDMVRATASVYAVEADLQGRYPFKGDLHLHSNHSDGAQSCKEIAVATRRAGYSFMAITDHGKMEPSQRLVQDLKGFGSPCFSAYPGEEIHLPGHQVHILNIGGKNSVNQAVRDDPGGYAKQCTRIQKGLPGNTGADPEHLAAALWAFDKVRESGGLSVFSHPYWRRSQGYDLGTPLTEALLDRPAFDAIELISGYPKEHTESNLLQLARYGELLYRGIRLPVVGTSDAHDLREGSPEGQFGCFYTLAFAPDHSYDQVAGAIRECRSVAAHKLPGEQLRLYGPYRYVKYGLFLSRQFLADHDALAEKEAALLAQFFDGKDVCSGKQAVWSDIKSLFNNQFDWCGEPNE